MKKAHTRGVFQEEGEAHRDGIPGYAELKITINPIGIEKVEIIGIEGDADSETMGIDMYQQLATAIHRWSKEAKSLLCSHWEAKRTQKRAINILLDEMKVDEETA